VMPSRTETLGLVVLEAMSSCRPVVAARAGGIPEMIQHGLSGYLFDEEAEAVVAIRELLDSPEKRCTMGKIARGHASHLGWRSATLQLVEQYKKACALQTISPMPSPAPAHPGLGYRTKKAFGRSTLFAIRKLLP
jgi:glycosyltransferase involved in cell wall biosynthesis